MTDIIRLLLTNEFAFVAAAILIHVGGQALADIVSAWRKKP